MPNHNDAKPVLGHHTLIAYQAARELLQAVVDAQIAHAGLREQAERAALSACLNTGEGANAVSPGSKRRAYAIAKGEAGEAACAVELAVQIRKADPKWEAIVNQRAARAIALLAKLAR